VGGFGKPIFTTETRRKPESFSEKTILNREFLVAIEIPRYASGLESEAKL